MAAVCMQKGINVFERNRAFKG